jgi:hypothetical protein
MSFLDEKFTSKYDDNPKLKGKQKNLPDALQKSIVGKTNEGVVKDLEMKAMEASSLEEFLDDVYQDYPQHKGKWEIEDFLKKYYLNAGGPIDEGKVKDFLKGAALLAALIGLNKAASENIYKSDPKIKALTSKYEKAEKEGDKKAMADFKKEIEKRKLQWDTGKVDESKTIELPADTTFTVDLKHLMKKHMDEGKSKEDTIKLTKALMAKLHDKGEVKVDGTKVTFKENKTNEASFMGAPLETFSDYYDALSVAAEIGVAAAVAIVILAKLGIAKGKQLFAQGKEAVMNWYEQNKLNEQEDTQLALPEPPARDYLGDDGKDYEGGMAKSQMLKMKKYAAALCDMIDDESQLESWVQAKLTKASEYMSAVYHYLDYQKSKMNEAIGDVIPDGEWQKLDIEWIMDEPDVNRPDYQEGPLYGTTADGRAFESYGNWTPFEDEYRPLRGEEVVEIPLP